MSDRTAVVERPITCIGIVPSSPYSIGAALRYYSSDPCAIQLVFLGDDTDSDVIWTFSRELLSTVLDTREPTGFGDIRFWIDGTDIGSVMMALTSPDGNFIFRLRVRELLQFLYRSYALVPQDGESKRIKIDAVIAKLLKK